MTRRRGRPKGEDGPVVTRRSLLETASRVIGRDGFSGASMRGIASEAGVSLPTLQNHFKTKDVLWKAVIDELLVPQMAGRSEPRQGDHESLLHAAVAARLEAAVSRPGLSGRLLTDASSEGDERLQYLAEATQSPRQADRELLRELRDSGVIRAVDIDAFLLVTGIALSTLSSAKSAARHLIGLDLDDNAERERMVAGITDLLLHGVLPRKRETPPG